MHLRLLLKMMMKMPYVILGPPTSQLGLLRLQNLTKENKKHHQPDYMFSQCLILIQVDTKIIFCRW